jgi:ADP-ribose pyrophosphatase
MKVTDLKKLFSSNWLNIYEASFKNKDKNGKWFFASRDSEKTLTSPDKCNAVVIVPKYKNPDGTFSYVLIREFRVPLLDYEWGFPAGLIEEGHTVDFTVFKELKEETGLNVTKILEISPPVYSSTGLTDESVQIVIVECDGKPTNANNEDSELIETHIMTIEEIEKLFKSNVKISARTWCFLHGLIK